MRAEFSFFSFFIYLLFCEARNRLYLSIMHDLYGPQLHMREATNLQKTSYEIFLYTYKLQKLLISLYTHKLWSYFFRRYTLSACEKEREFLFLF